VAPITAVVIVLLRWSSISSAANRTCSRRARSAAVEVYEAGCRRSD